MISSAILLPTHAEAGTGSRITIRDLADVTSAQRDQMFALLDRYYLHATREQFDRDLAEKEWVLIGTEPETNRVCGFTTLMRVGGTVDRERVAAFFSGDTVTESCYWGRGDTSRGIGRLLHHMFEVASDDPRSCYYWFVISSTYRSYRLLPMLFREFHPSPRRPMPAAAASILGSLVREKFGSAYDPRTSIIRYPRPTVLRSRFHATAQGPEDEWKRFFRQANPGQGRGDRFATLTALSPDNLTRLGHRLLDRAAAANATSLAASSMLTAG